MIYVGIDDTDTQDSPGTNKVARSLVADLPSRLRCRLIVRHQLLVDPRIPYTSKNSSCSIWLEADRETSETIQHVAHLIELGLRQRFQSGSDPGLCVAVRIPPELISFGRRCQAEVTTQDEARSLAANLAVTLRGLGGTQDGVIGALAAVGLAATGDDGRIVQIRGYPDDLSGLQNVDALRSRGVDELRCCRSGRCVHEGTVDVGKHLRPNLRGGRIVLFVEPDAGDPPGERYWRAVRYT